MPATISICHLQQADDDQIQSTQHYKVVQEPAWSFLLLSVARAMALQALIRWMMRRSLLGLRPCTSCAKAA